MLGEVVSIKTIRGIRRSNAFNNIYTNGYGQPNERTNWRHPLRRDRNGMGTEDSEY